MNVATRKDSMWQWGEKEEGEKGAPVPGRSPPIVS